MTKTIDELDPATVAALTDVFEISKAGVTEKLTAAQIQTLFGLTFSTESFKTVYKTADESVISSTTFVTDADLQFSVDANGEYVIMLFLYFDKSGGAGSLGLDFVLPSGEIIRNSNLWTHTNVSTLDATVQHNVTVPTTPTTPHQMMLVLRARIDVTPGIINLRWKNNNNEAFNMTIHRESFIMFKKLN